MGDACRYWAGRGRIDVKFLLAGMLIVGFFVIFHGNLLTDNKTRVSCGQQHHGDRFDAGQGANGVATHTINSTESSAPCHIALREVEHANCVVSPRPVAERTGDDFVVRRDFKTYGSAAALFVQLGTYRGGEDSFAVVGLASKPIHVYANAGFECEWVPAERTSAMNASVKGKAWKLLPDWNMGRQYTVVVVNCSFAEAVGIDSKGGELVLYASHGDGAGEDTASMERIVALKEEEGEYEERKFVPPYPYEFVYCGSPLFGKINPQRIREWIVYHVKLFGPRSHFFFYDTGGLSPSVREILQPWLELGYLTLHDVRQQARFDGYYANQFLILNDCFHRTRFLSNWTFFFDVDEFLYVPPHLGLQSVMSGFSNYTQVIYQQHPMSCNLCEASRNRSGVWGFEKLIYRNVKTGITWDSKYAIQPRNAFATGVHRSDHMIGASLGLSLKTRVSNMIRYYHFHNVLTEMGNLCREFANATDRARAGVIYDSNQVPFKVDRSLQKLAKSVKRFEFQRIGPQPTLVG